MALTAADGVAVTVRPVCADAKAALAAECVAKRAASTSSSTRSVRPAQVNVREAAAYAAAYATPTPPAEMFIVPVAGFAVLDPVSVAVDESKLYAAKTAAPQKEHPTENVTTMSAVVPVST